MTEKNLQSNNPAFIELDKKINKINNTHLAIGAFFGLGMAASFLVSPAFIPSFVGLPFLLSGVIDKCTLKSKSKNASHSLFEKTYENAVQKWLDNYLESSENLTEKKYRYIFTYMYLKDKGIKISDVYSFKSVVEKVSEEIFHKRESRHHLATLYSSLTSSVNACSFLEEDRDNPEKIAIAKRVCQEFMSAGLAGNRIRYFRSYDFDFLFELQEQQLTEYDKKNIKKVTQLLKTKKNSHVFDSRDATNIINDDLNEILLPMISNENTKEGLEVCKDFFNEYFSENKKVLDFLDSAIDRKINYLKLGKEILAKRSDVKTNKKNKL